MEFGIIFSKTNIPPSSSFLFLSQILYMFNDMRVIIR